MGKPFASFPDLPKRIISALTLAVIGLVALIIGGWAVRALALLIAVICLWELARVLRGGEHRKPLWWLLIGAMILAIAFGSFVAIYESGSQGIGKVCFLLSIIICSDAGAYFVGRWINGPKLWIAVSPGKSWSGAVGGLVSGGIAGWLVAVLLLQDSSLLWLALLLSVVCQLGDLAFSAIKRSCGVKNFANWIPGHGGALDRFDGAIAVFLVYFFQMHIGQWLD